MERDSRTFEEKPVNFRTELEKYLRHWPWFIISILICLTVAFLYLRYATPQYRVSATMLIKDDKSGMEDGAAAFSDLEIFNTTRNLDNEIEVLKSKSLLKRVFQKMPQLQASIFSQGDVIETETYGENAPLRVEVSFKSDARPPFADLSLTIRDQ